VAVVVGGYKLWRYVRLSLTSPSPVTIVEVAEETERAKAPQKPLAEPAKATAAAVSDADLEVPFSELHRLRGVLDREGVAIVTGVIAADELRSLEQEFVNDLNDLIDEDAVRACDDQRVREAYERFRREGLHAFPYATAKQITPIPGFALQGCVCAGTFSWHVRKHPRVHSVYSAVFPEAGPLVSSLDVTFFTADGGPAHDSYAGSAHVDQNANDSRTEYGLGSCSVYQGILYVWPAGEGCTTTCVWPGSHKTVWPRLMKDTSCVDKGAGGDHYTEIRDVRDAALRKELVAGWQKNHRRLRVPAGALLLWNSRTVHTGIKAGPRFAQAVCLEPASARPQAQRVAKMRLAALGIPGTHWARVGHQHDMLPSCQGWAAQRPICKARGADMHSEVDCRSGRPYAQLPSLTGRTLRPCAGSHESSGRAVHRTIASGTQHHPKRRRSSRPAWHRSSSPSSDQGRRDAP